MHASSLPPELRVSPGRPEPLGARWDGAGTNVAVSSPEAVRVTVCLLDEAGVEHPVELTHRSRGTWHGYLPGVGPGTRYGLRVDGPWDPWHGRRFNPAKRLLDPYALAVDGQLAPHDAVRGHVVGSALGLHAGYGDDTTRDARDSGPYVPAAVVVDESFDWGADRPPGVPWSQTVLYELHVRGFTATHPEVPEPLRGTYAGLAHPAVLDYLTALGVTTLELLPVAHFVTELELLERGGVNYWGYSPLAFLAPHAGYSSAGRRGEQVREFKQMVADLHAAGLEVVLDVVFNHTAEGGRTGPTLSLRGLANNSYYRLDHGRGYLDVTGCGNTLDLTHPSTLRLVMDALRYWVSAMHVDGFRFDLAATLARGSGGGFDPSAPFLAAIAQDPVLRNVKLIAEPWDLGPQGYQLGSFGEPWVEWNDRYRDAVRGFWLAGNRPGAAHPGVRDLGYRLSGSSDIFDGPAGRGPLASVNFVTAHDGATLHDLVTYEGKHNHGNGEGNRDGAEENLGWNCGVEGPTQDPAVLRVRRRLARDLMATLLLSTGVPMITAGDEIGRTQHGNNNAYCQDNETSWLDWSLQPWQLDLHDTVVELLRLRREHPVLRQEDFFAGQHPHVDAMADLAWFDAAGEPMGHDAWHSPGLRTISWYLAGDAGAGQHVVGLTPSDPDASYLIVLHGGPDDVDVVLPGPPWAQRYTLVLDTAEERPVSISWAHPAGERVRRPSFSLAVFHAHR